MDWQTRMTAALAYLESRLREDLDLEGAAREANCSTFHFCRMFEVITGIGPGEYVRRRRLSEAARELSYGESKVTDIALRFGYESPDAFTRAFRREFGCLPSEARRPGVRLHSYPPLAFRIVLVGAVPMEYRIEDGDAVAMTGIDMRVCSKDGSNFRDIPAFWDEVYADGRCEALARKADFGGMGICGVCREFDMSSGEFTYSIAIDKPADMNGLPEGATEFSIPASTWGKFTSRGPLRPNLQNTLKRIYAEWLPVSEWEQTGTAEIEFYPDIDPNAEDYWCEYWIPLKRRNERTV